MYRWHEHTGELELAIEAPTREAVFVDALVALCELLGGRAANGPERRVIEVSAADGPALLAEWLSELVYLADAEAFVPERVEALVLDDTGLQATVAGGLGSPSAIVKAVTYHRLQLEQTSSGWRASVVLDV